jgi:adsorption protein B
MTGIALAGWDKLGWRGGVAQKWMLLRDRKAVFAAIILFCAYICILLTAALTLATAVGLYVPAPLPNSLIWLLWTNLAFLIWRLSIRSFFVAKLYGWRQGLISIPRTFAANIISIMAARRACFSYLKHIFGGPLGWDKTEHQFIPIAAGTSKNV